MIDMFSPVAETEQSWRRKKSGPVDELMMTHKYREGGRAAPPWHSRIF
jgi:hypothetical protein